MMYQFISKTSYSLIYDSIIPDTTVYIPVYTSIIPDTVEYLLSVIVANKLKYAQ